MTTVLFADNWPVLAVLALASYTGVLLCGALFSVAEGDGPQVQLGRTVMALGVVFFLSMLPIPESSARLVGVQAVGSVVAGGSIGPLLVHWTLREWRDLRAFRAGTTARPLGVAAQLLLYSPAALLIVAASIVRTRAFVSATEAPDASVIPLTPWLAVWNIVGLAYFLAAGLLGLASLPPWRGNRLLRPTRAALLLLVLVSLPGLVFWVLVLVRDPSPPTLANALRSGMLAASVLWLTPAVMLCRVAYDAVLRRIITFHLLAAVAGVILLGGGALAGWLGMTPSLAWGAGLATLALAAIALPGRLERGIERWLFPRAAALRARLFEIAARPLTAATRAQAGAELLRQVVEALDCDGGAIVLQPTPVEPASVEHTGCVDPGGETPADLARFVTRASLRGAPRRTETLPYAEGFRLMHAEVALVCPLEAERLEATLLLGRRRGWLYDTGTVQALRQFARQAGLALENLTLVTQRVAAERALAHAEKLAAIGETAARIAHDIRNPVTAARSLAQQLARGPSTAADAEAAGLILGELERVERQVASLLRFSRREEFRLEPVDVGALVRATAEGFRPRLEAADVALALDVVDGVVVRADGEKLRQVLINLIENALDALAGTAPHDRRLAVGVSAANGTATVRVADTGRGVPAAALSRLFEPFFSLKEHGTGLGLAIVKGIVEAHGGQIHAERGQSTGLTFHIALPLTGPDLGPDSPASPSDA